MSWYAKEREEVLHELGTTEKGLPAAEAAERFAQEGPNALPERKGEGLALIFLRQFQSPLIYILLAAAGAVLLIGESMDAAIILFVLLFNAAVGTVQEGRAQRTLLALRQFVETSATVVRDGREIILPDREIVRGDVILLAEGGKVPADARLLSVVGLKTEESALTGESEPVVKVIEKLPSSGSAPAEQRNMVFKGTNVAAGSAAAVVVATGVATVIGGIARDIAAIETEIPLKASIRRLSRVIVAVVAAVCALIFLLGIARGEGIREIFPTVVSLAVSVIPEGLPIVMTLVLASGVWRMSKRNALVKKLQAVEALGQASVIAVDKTGTITKNELVVREVWSGGRVFRVSGEGYAAEGGVEEANAAADARKPAELLMAGRIAALCAGARVSFSETEGRWIVAGDPTEAALRIFAQKLGIEKEALAGEYPPLAEIPFDYRLRYHAAIHDTPAGGAVMMVAGAPETVLELCERVAEGGAHKPLTQKERVEIEERIAEMSERGLRVVAGAFRERVDAGAGAEAVRGLTLAGLYGMQDTIRPEAGAALERARSAGIRVVMITGDHKITARAIAKEAGIWKEGDGVLTGEEVERMSDETLSEALAGVAVFARVTPEHKLRIVRAYKARGEVIAMTGDGVNDAPPLVAADLGVAMGKIGTEVAKEAADIVLLDDNFGSIVSAVEEGRSIYKTIKKVILYLFSTSIGEALVIVGALLLGYPLPVLAAQIIWLNFVTDGFLDVSLAMEPKERGLLSRRFERPRPYLVDGSMVRRMLLMAAPMTLGTLFLFGHYFPADIEKAWTVSLTTLAMFQWFNAWNCRSETESVFSRGFFANKFLLGATGIVVALQVLAVYAPFLQKILHTVPLGLAEWIAIVPIAASILLVEEARKALRRVSPLRT